MNLCFASKGNNLIRLGTFLPVDRQDLKKYVKMFDRHWIEA